MNVLRSQMQAAESPVTVTVIIPTLNRSKLLREALDSLCHQTLDPSLYEILVIDDGSHDDTPEVVRTFAESAPCRIVYHPLEKDFGPAYARNVGARLARSEILAFTDSDCRPGSDWLENGVKNFRDGVAFVSGSVLFKPEQRIRFFSGIYYPVHSEDPTYPTCNIFFRRAEFLEMGGMDETLSFKTFLGDKAVECADTDLAWRMKERGLTNLFLPGLVIYHEVGLKKPWLWLIDPVRLFVLPALVKRHPQLRRDLLYARYFFNKEDLLFYLLAAGVLLGAALHWAFLALALPYPIWIARRIPQNLTVRKFPKLLVQMPFLVARRAVVCAGLIYGSIRFRCLVL
jgi:glycosyltransferase involved in cell wall biosynthesis